MLKQTKSSPMVARTKLSHVPLPALTKIGPRTAAGTVEGALSEKIRGTVERAGHLLLIE
jgi:hypothetical protein